MKKFKNSFLIFIYIKVAIVLLALLFAMLNISGLKDFAQGVEGKTFDVRQSFTSKFRKSNPDIVILALDTQSYNYIIGKYGDWPVERRFWANIVKNLEKYNPKFIVFDMLFPSRSSHGGKTSDEEFIKTVNSYDNVILSMNFLKSKNETDIIMPEYLKNSISNDNKIIKNERVNFPYFQPILPEILKENKNIAFVNATVEPDGIMRYNPIMCYYDGNYYKSLALFVALKYLDEDSNNFSVVNNNLVLKNGRKIPINDSGRAIINWYNNNAYKEFDSISAYKTIPVSEFVKAVKNNDTKFLSENFENKIVFIGTTTSLMGDIKSAPVAKNMAGVEFHTTMLNNILDNSLIFHVPIWADIVLALMFCVVVALLVIKIHNVVLTITYFILSNVIYIMLSILLMYYFNIWLGLVFPLSCAIVIFITTYIVKYVLKSKDYDKTYKLAVTDGMTGLFNHRYFQEEMANNTNNFKRYGILYSLIMIDIDFFKKFNDTYGHQSGDAVLIQVASILKSCVRTTDIVCRYGGEEMSIILTNTKKSDAIITANKICEAVRNNEVTLATGDKVHVTISVGVATIGDNGDSVETLIKYTDACLYKAKENGRNQVVSEK